MFGYVRTQKEDLRVRQDTLYRAAYCGLCREMGRCTGQCSRLSLSYDMVFLYLVRASLTGITPRVEERRCFVHPLRTRPTVMPDPELSYAARVSALLVYGKVQDDLADETGIRRLGKHLVRPFAAHAKKRAELDGLYDGTAALLTELSALEAEKRPSVDAPADLFGKLLAGIFAYGLDGDAEKIARQIGFRTGRWIYAVDAADDLDADAKNGSYNPFILLYGGEIDDDRRSVIGMSFKYDLKALAAAVDLMEDNDLTEIVRNIIYLGMPAAAEKALRRKGEESE